MNKPVPPEKIKVRDSGAVSVDAKDVVASGNCQRQMRLLSDAFRSRQRHCDEVSFIGSMRNRGARV